MRKTADEMTSASGRRLVHKIINHHFGASAPGEKPKIEELSGGKTNYVYAVQHATGNLIVRIGADSNKLCHFMKEQWAIAKASELAVPVPKVLEVGHEAAHVPYMIAVQSAGTEATYHPERNLIIQELGHYAAMIHSIQTTGFGSTFDWSQNELSHNVTWADFLTNELRLEEALEILLTNDMLTAPRVRKVRAALEAAGEQGRTPRLNHGDLRLKNALVDAKGTISCLLDWEHCTSNLAPEWDLSIALHDLSVDEKQAFLKGYGIKSDNLSAMSPTLKALNLVNYSPAVKRLQKSRNAGKLEEYRARLRGELDLYDL